MLDLILQAAVAAALAFITLVFLAPTKFGERFIGYTFDRRLAEFKNKQDREIEGLRATLGHLNDRGARSNEREFAAIEAAWELYAEAWVMTQRCIISFTRHADLTKLSEQEFADFLLASELSEVQTKELFKAQVGERNRVYARVLQWEQIRRAGMSIYDARSILRRKGIFVPDELARILEEGLRHMSGAQVQREMEFAHGGQGLTAVSEFVENANKVYDDALSAVRDRMLGRPAPVA